MKINDLALMVSSRPLFYAVIVFVCLLYGAFAGIATSGSFPHDAMLYAPSIEDKLSAMVIPAAPFIKDDDDVCTILAWLTDLSIKLDPRGVGIHFVCDIEKDRTPSRSYEYYAEPQHVRGPHIRNVSIADYLLYLAKMRGLHVRIYDDVVFVTDAATDSNDT